MIIDRTLVKVSTIFLLQLAILITVSSSVESAGWVESPPLWLIAILATCLSMAAINHNRSSYVNHSFSLITGLSITYVSGLYLCQAENWYLRFQELHSRAWSWWLAVIGEDATTDTLPLSVLIVGVTWMLSYVTSWYLFKYKLVWASVLPLGVVLTINITYLPQGFSYHILGFLGLMALMFIHSTNGYRIAVVESSGTNMPRYGNAISMFMGLLLVGIVLIAAGIMPIGKTPPDPLQWVFKPADRAMYELQDELYRIFGVVPGYNQSPIRFFGSLLPLVRPISTAEDVVMVSDSEYPLYWSAVAYDEYTSKAWKVQETESRPVLTTTGNIEEDSAEQSDSASGLRYQVDMHVDSPYVLVAGEPTELNHAAIQTLPISTRFMLNLEDETLDRMLPLELQQLTRDLTTKISRTGSIETLDIPANFMVTKLIESNEEASQDTIIDLVSCEPGCAYPYEVALARALDGNDRISALEVIKTNLQNSTVAIKPIEPLGEGSQYSAVSEIHFGSEENLRSSTGSYPSDVFTRYVQTPESLPERVSSLTEEIVKDAVTPYGKALLIEDYLRNLDYDASYQAVPHDADTVDHFLYDSRRGHSDYFASAMAMMLRTQGIPTRLVLGFGPGVTNPDKQGFIVRDVDNHSWPEVYFSGIGWVPFEPTPIYDTRSRGLPSTYQEIMAIQMESYDAGLGQDMLGSYGDVELGDSDEDMAISEDGTVNNQQGGPLSGGMGMRMPPSRYFGTPIGVGGILFAVILISITSLFIATWTTKYLRLFNNSIAYEKLLGLFAFVGIRRPNYQTAYEFSHQLAIEAPALRSDLSTISESYVRLRYGGLIPASSEIEDIKLAWKRIRNWLVAGLW